MFSVCVLCAATACAAPTSYAGISLIPGDADPEIQSLANRAQSGSKQAQLELGIRYEEGDGVPVDWGRARVLYRSAAKDSLKEVAVFDGGQSIDFAIGLNGDGLMEARRRLSALNGGND